MLRTYQIAGDDLVRLHEAMKATVQRNAGCAECWIDLCAEHQKDADLLQQLADALSMRRTGISIAFSTQLAQVVQEQEKEAEQTIH